MPLHSKKIVRQSIPDALVADLKERILNGDLKEGDQIRQELLAEEYNVSRMPVREALRRLEAEGLIIFHTNKSAIVTEPSLEEISEVFDLRVLLEVDALSHAIPRMTEAHFIKMREVLTRLEEAYHSKDVKSWGALNSEFHMALLDAAPRPQTKAFVQKINYQTDRYIRLQLILSGGLERAEREHRDLLAYCEKGDIENAATLLTQHIQSAKKQLLESVEKYREHKTNPA